MITAISPNTVLKTTAIHKLLKMWSEKGKKGYFDALLYKCAIQENIVTVLI